MTRPEFSRTPVLFFARVALATAVLAFVLAPGAAHAQLSGPTVVQGHFVEEVSGPGLQRPKRGRCAGVLAEGASDLSLHCGHNFDRAVTVSLFRAAGDREEILRREGVRGDFVLDLELTPRDRRDVRRGDLGIRVESPSHFAEGDFEPPASATGNVIRLDLDLVDAQGVAGGSCTTVLLGIGSGHWLFDFYVDCAHELEGEVSAGIFDRNTRSRLTRPGDEAIADLGDARTPMLLDWRIAQHASPVGAFFGGSLELVVSGGDRELRAALDGCMSGGEAVCLQQRFQVSTRYVQDVAPGGGLVPARPLTFGPGAALFSFSDPEQVEVMVNLENRCAETGFYDLRASSASARRPRVTIVDTVTGEEREVELFRRGGRCGPAGEPLSVIERRAFPCR